jgi:hypothetical protein
MQTNQSPLDPVLCWRKYWGLFGEEDLGERHVCPCCYVCGHGLGVWIVADWVCVEDADESTHESFRYLHPIFGIFVSFFPLSLCKV